MKRKIFNITVTDTNGGVVSSSVKHAFNSAIRESEKLIREIALKQRSYLNGDKPVSVVGTNYTRIWANGGYEFTVSILKQS